MKGTLTAFVLLLAAAMPACSANSISVPNEPITSLAVLHKLDNAQASRALRVAFEGVVTYYRPGNSDLFVQDGDAAIYVDAPRNLSLALGDRVLITGRTHDSFKPEIQSDSVRFLRHDEPPKAISATYRQMIQGDLDARRVTTQGTVLSANLVTDSGSRNLYLQVLMDGGSIDAEAPVSGPVDTSTLLDAEVELTGAVSGKFDNKVQLTGILLQIPSIAGIRILKPAVAGPSSLPVTPMDQIITGYDVEERSKRIRIQGTITYYQPGSAIVLQDGGKSLWVTTQYEQPLTIGEQVYATGFPSVRNGSLALTRGEVEDRGSYVPIAPAAVSAADADEGMHTFDLITVEGRLLMAVRDADQDRYVLASSGHVYSAVLRHPERGFTAQLQPFKDVPIGSTIQTTGICIVENGDRYLGPVAFNVLLRSTEDITIIRDPSPLNVDNLIVIVVVLLLVVLLVAARQWLIERRVRRETTELAYVEKRRSVILEDINGSRPLPEILDQITELVSFRLRGAPCWFELADGSRFGNRPDEFDGLRTIDFSVRGHGGVSLGVLHASLHDLTKPAALEETTLAMAAALATLALETRRLYSDLVHRSEFDLLTEIHNRFSFEKKLNQLIEDHQGPDNIFGLIYVDLDGFKQLNDQYGHQVGDLYLQAAASRMKHQIRPSDLLARIGGDEFALLVAKVTRREDVLEVAHRVGDCFTRPFSIEHHQLNGAASVGIAFYPEDGATKDELLNAADAAMYAGKNAKKAAREFVPAAPHSA
jgi:diguanylate cyclase (GGDEF)-like protein